MGKNKILIPFLSLFLLSWHIAYALPTITSDDNQTFNQNQSPTLLRNITIKEDDQTSYITKGEIKITIPETIKIIFDSKTTTEYIVLYGTAVESGKVKSKPAITFENKDKTLVIPIDQDLSPGESFIIAKAYVEGFIDSPLESKSLELQINDDPIKYLDPKQIYINISSTEDTHIPDYPTNIQVSYSIEGALITWTDPTDLDLQTIDILKGENADAVSGNPIATVIKATEIYLDKDVKSGQKLKYILRANDGRNLSLNSPEYLFIFEPPACSEESNSVCGVDGNTYLNQCLAEVNKIEISHPGECEKETINDVDSEETPKNEGIFCTEEYAPICGTNGKSYPNQCYAEKDGIAISYEGECIKIPNLIDITNHWAKDEINYLVKKGVVKGNADNTFSPDANLNRAESAALLYRLITSSEPPVNDQQIFTDFIPGSWYNGYLAELKNLKLINGNPDGSFQPAKSINRVEFLTMTLNIQNYLVPGQESTKKILSPIFADIDSSAWYSTFVLSAYNKGYINGKDCGQKQCFHPDQPITRAEAAIILYNVFSSYLEEKIN